MERIRFHLDENEIFTQDEDFLAIASRGIGHCGIVYCHIQSRSIGQILGSLLLLWDCLSLDEMQDHVEFI